MTTDAAGSMTTELIRFVDEDSHVPTAAASRPQRSWRILIIDDDQDVHQATLFALERVELFGRQLAFVHAYSAQQARQLLLTETDLALILLDVVMETPAAGLELVDFIRSTAQLKNTRIVLRTGQPGYAPEHDTILRYDINDYKTKSELTQHKLLTTVTAAIRSYEQFCTIEASRKGLELIVNASAHLIETPSVQTFAAGVMTQLAALLGTLPEALVCAQGECGSRQYTVLAAAGHFTSLINQPLENISDAQVRQLLLQVLESGQSHHGTHETVLYFGQKNGFDMAAYIGATVAAQDIDFQLLKVFSANMSVCLRNLALLHRLHADAYVDPLLRLPNRTHFIEEISSRLQGIQPGYTLALIDIDDFASVNDLMGHAYGDELLRAFASQLVSRIGTDMVLARVDSNTFGLLGSSDRLSPQRLAATATDAMLVFGQPHRISVTTGIALLDESTGSGADWLKNASIALKHAKRQNRGGHVFYSASMAARSRSRAQLLANLHAAFGEDRLFMAYQPQIDLQTGALIGMEALIRWRTQDGSMVPPDQFIPVAEQSGLIVSLGDWVLQTACADMVRFKAQGLVSCHMAVNVSVVQFQSPGFYQRVLTALAQSGLAAHELELEITESVAMLGSDAVASMLGQLRSAGIAVAIDDFGTGYSSLSYLEKLPLDRIKIDRAFVLQMGQQGGPRIAEMITQLGHKLGLRVLAEGIEDATAWAALRDMGCHEGQGFYISRPLDYASFCIWLAQRPHSALQYGVV
ncbi:MAG: GGDEF/EAL domain-containing response regulator [Rhodoferax sp.]